MTLATESYVHTGTEKQRNSGIYGSLPRAALARIFSTYLHVTAAIVAGLSPSPKSCYFPPEIVAGEAP